MPAAPLAYASKVGDARIGDRVPNHAGEPPGVTYDFFAPPPPDIGPLRSAESTLRLDRPPWSRGTKLIVGVAPALLIFGGFLMAACFYRRSDAVGLLVMGGFVAVLPLIFGIGIAFIWDHSCTYVGDEGAALLRVLRRRDAPPKVHRVRFAEAAELRASRIRQHVVGAYVSTDYDYRWTDASGRLLMRLTGSYRAGKQKRPRPGDAYHFARAAETAWSNHLLARAQASLAADGAIPFRVDKNRWLQVGPGFIEFHFGGEPVRVDKADIAKVTLANGIFAFQHHDAKWFSRAGKYSFQYGAMGNAQVFLLALDKLMGYRWG